MYMLKTIGNSKKAFTIGILLAIVFAVTFHQISVLAGAGESARGFAWGGTSSVDGAYQGMGWISMNNISDGSGTSYGVNIPAGDGDVTGYAWSGMDDTNGQPNAGYGWISFREVDLAGCAPALAQARRVGNTLTGGARILSIMAAMAVPGGNAGGYDGCIDLSGITIAGNALSGYAWSSDLGWIDFSGVSLTFLPQCSDGIDNEGDGFADFGAGPLNDPGCTDANDNDETDGAGSPDLTMINTAPLAGANLDNPASVDFSGTITNNTAQTLVGENVWADVEIDWNQPNCAVAVSETVVNAGGPWTQMAVNATQNVISTLTAATSQLQNGTHCYRMIVDRGNIVTESDNTNNAGLWSTFTIANLPQCSDGIDNDGVGGTDLADADCPDGSGGSEGGGATPCPVETVGNCLLPVSNISGQVSGQCTGTHNGDPFRGTCSRTCDTVTGTWGNPSTDQCYAGNITADPSSILPNKSTKLTWEVTPSTSCWISGSNGDDWDNVLSDNTDPREEEITSLLADDTRFDLACGTDTNLLDFVTVDVSGPEINASPRIVDFGKTSNISWKPKGLVCTVKGGGVDLAGVVADGSVDPIINAQTTFTLNCTDPLVPGSSFIDTVTVDITGWQDDT
jgi:hypothetical protein